MRMIRSLFSRGGILAAAAVCSLLVPFAAAQAAPVTYSFAGNFDNDPSSIYSVSGTFTFDNARSGSGGVYNGAVTDFTWSYSANGILQYTSTYTPGANAVTVAKDMPSLFGGTLDRWALVSAATSTELLVPTGNPADGAFAPFNFDLRYDRTGGGLFSDTSLQDPPSFGSLGGVPASDRVRWRLFFEDAGGIPSAYVGSITSLTAVPLPAAVVLFGAGLISLVGLGAGGLRNLHGSKV
ncbi:MAG: hypothetical protein OEU68_01405 [Nitrospira sp.]|nr:hypothetical protein [Nitrospira sp.]MDH4242724.1 hypothetical protein [Nitrospira sp.]MDH4354933.1 hypothetical protein [Nitrospira sp.]MDH5317256.1 hypothetical protein [Nitrospira sp.]